MLKRLLSLAETVWRFLGPRGLILAGAVFLVAAATGSIAGHQAYRFAWTDPRFCFFCHIHDYAVVAWKESAHGGVTTCHDCHHMGLLHYTYIGVKTFINPPSYPEDLEHPPSIPSDLCIQCHLRGTVRRENWTLPFQYDKLKRIPTIDVTAGHRWHMAATSEMPTPELHREGGAKRAVEAGFHPTGVIDCWHCHGSEHNRPHQFRATDVNCRSCHSEAHLSEQLRFVGTDCLLCHINAFVLDYRHPASRPLKPEEVEGKSPDLEDLLRELKRKFPIEEMVLE